VLGKTWPAFVVSISGAGAPPNDIVSRGNPAIDVSMRSNAIEGTLHVEDEFASSAQARGMAHPPVVVMFSCLINLVT
jgi:hypothetical protein